MLAAAQHLGGEIAVTGTVREYRCEQREGLDVGVAVLDDAARTTLYIVNEYMALDVAGARRASFPDLITTFDEAGQPLASADVEVGQPLASADVEVGKQDGVLVAPAGNLLLSRTMYMPEVYAPVEELLGIEFAPAARVLADA
ncbi:hypothetical protein [Streptomyces sp. NPDC058548]|uniref:S-methyl thiohydantoin desulfurase domain-containing protein n=1 Tax=unclassified Streptomyces TaxID=2593676 RepID=UPI00365867A4